ncbi:MAG TPA: Nif3-like dinuclear metal center hexameric protein [Verrucomicrobiae bacterium]|nr:Nif3-like dinuclear metal center hexameric protein [Verrucomicrobiae bacterium]
MAATSVTQLVQYADRLLKTAGFTDYPGAVNGLQVQNSGRVTRIAAAVDGSLTTVRLAIEEGANLLVVHHGLFWSPSHPWTGRRYELIKTLVEADMAVYSSHLPLDAHPTLGNNALLARSLGIREFQPFFFDKGRHLGVRGSLNVHRDELARRLEKATGASAKILPGGPARCRKIGIVTGGAGAEMKIAAAEGVDTFITGEGPHWTFALAEDIGINLLYGGHYATETFGVKALAEHLAKKFRVPWSFIDHPTGL